MIPIVMAGGFGTRIRPLSANRPKPMLAVVNRPILERVLVHLRGFGMEEAVLLTYYDPDKIRAHFLTRPDAVPGADLGSAGGDIADSAADELDAYL